jgi:methylated-DNA-[protein]-cysteine S-methyltransferase
MLLALYWPMDQQCAIARIASPVGLIEIVASASEIWRISIHSDGDAPPLCPPDHELLCETVTQFSQWLAGDRQGFNLPLQPAATARGAILRNGIESVPFGTTTSYGALALAIGSSARAVGQSCKRNPFPIVIPCHRIISTSGPEFYSAGQGAPTKAWLLRFEQSVVGAIDSDHPVQGDLFAELSRQAPANGD